MVQAELGLFLCAKHCHSPPASDVGDEGRTQLVLQPKGSDQRPISGAALRCFRGFGEDPRVKALRGQRGKLVDVVLVVLVGRHAQIDCPPALVVRSEVVVDVPGEKHRRGIDREEAGGAVKLDHTTHLLLGAVQERVKVQPAVSEPNHLLVCALRHVPLHEGHTSRVVLELDGGATLPVAFRRDEGGAIEVDLAGHPPTAVKRMVVDWPSRRLAQMTLIDTPGISSITAEASARTVEFLAHDDDDPGEADAVIYLLRHVHADDVRFLEAFHDRELAQPTPVNALGVLSRADEIGVCRLDALESASRIAARLSADPRIRRLCQTVVPVAGLLAQAAAMLTEDHVAVLRAVRSTPDDVRDHLMLTPDRFVAQRDDVPVVPAHRMQVLSDLGWFGVRLGVQALLDDPAMTASRLSPLLREASGIERLRAVLIEQLAARADVLKAR